MRESEKLRQELYEGDEEEIHLEKDDMKALMISGFLTIGLPIHFMILLIMGVTILLFGLY